MNSSYVLIKYHTFLQTRERVGARPSASRVSVLLSWCGATAKIGLSIRPAGRAHLSLSGFRTAGRIAPAQITGGQMALSDQAQMGVVAPDRGGLLQSGDTWVWPFWTGLCRQSDGAEGNIPVEPLKMSGT